MRAPDQSTGPLRCIVELYRSGHLDRRAFVTRATALGVGASAIHLILGQPAFAQEATPAASPEALTAFSAVGTENQTRGEGGELRIIQYQAVSSLSPHTAAGYSNFSAAQMVVEPLLAYLPDASLVPVLAAEVPSLENGGLSDDGLTMTVRLKEGIVWSDGEPLTSEDVVFTTEWVKNPENASTNMATYQIIESVEAIDDLTVQYTFVEPTAFWFEAITGYVAGPIYPKHVFDAAPEAAAAFSSNPIGTGPYVVESFTPNDNVVYAVNERYREPNKPFFDRITMKGGGDAAAAARAVAQTDEFDFAWGPQVERDVLESIVTEDSPAAFVPIDPVNMERLALNHADPATEVDGQRAEVNTPNPMLSDPAVREAISMAINREQIADSLYDPGSIAAVNVLTGDEAVVSPNTSYTFDPAAAAAMLEEAGWAMDGDVRARDGVQLQLTCSTATTPRRQKAQAVVKSNLEAIGFGVSLEAVDSGIFFDLSAGNDQSYVKFYWDMEIYIQPQTSTRPLRYMQQWYAGPENSNVAQRSNGWSGSNNARWVNAEYDALYEQAESELDPDRLADLFIQMNDLIIQHHVLVPLVFVSTASIASTKLLMDNLIVASFAGTYANIANWRWAE